MSVLSSILSSKVRAAIFQLLFGIHLDALHVREIQRRSGFAIGTIQTELKKLHQLDLVVKERDGNRLYYRANQTHPIFPEISALVIKTVGLADVLKAALDKEREIRVAFVFGSITKGSEQAGSDVDLMVIGELGLRSLTRLLSGVTEKIGREINPYVLTTADFISRKMKKEHFLSQVLKESKLFIIGNDDDLNTMA